MMIRFNQITGKLGHMRNILIPGGVLCCLAFLCACSGDDVSDEEQIRQTIYNGKIASEQRNWRDLSVLIHNDYADRRGLNKNQLGGLVQRYFFMRSNIHLLTKMGASLTLAGPRTMMPVEVEKLGVDVVYKPEEAGDSAEAVMMMSNQLERQPRPH